MTQRAPACSGKPLMLITPRQPSSASRSRVTRAVIAGIEVHCDLLSRAQSNRANLSGVGRSNGESWRFAGAVTHTSGIPVATGQPRALVPSISGSTGYPGQLTSTRCFDDPAVGGEVQQLETDDGS